MQCSLLYVLRLSECKGNFYSRNKGTGGVKCINGLTYYARAHFKAQIIIHRVAPDKFSVDVGIDHLNTPSANKTQYTQVAVAPIKVGIADDIRVGYLSKVRVIRRGINYAPFPQFGFFQ